MSETSEKLSPLEKNNKNPPLPAQNPPLEFITFAIFSLFFRFLPIFDPQSP